jgi:hypothetical protein
LTVWEKTQYARAEKHAPISICVMAENEEGSLVAALLGMTGAGEAESGEAGGWHESAKVAARLPHSKAPASEGGC